MRLRPASPLAPHERRGFTLVELLIALAIIGILASIVLPNFLGSMRKSRRTEAFAALSEIQQRQERHRGNNATYVDSVTNAVNGSPPGLAMGSTRTQNGYYDLSLALIGGGNTGWIGTAVGVAGTSQEKDTACRALAVRFDGGNVRYAGAGSAGAIDWSLANPDPARCWAR